MASKQQDKGGKHLGDLPGNQTPNTPNIDESAREHGSRNRAQGEHKGSAQKGELKQSKSEHKGQASGESRAHGGGAGQHERRRHDKG